MRIREMRKILVAKKKKREKGIGRLPEPEKSPQYDSFTRPGRYWDCWRC
jgi:hypothetical protein